MSSSPESTPAMPSKPALWTGRVLSGLAVAMFLMGVAMNLSGAQQAVDGLKQMGYPEGVGVQIAIALLISTVLYIAPPTSVLGAILITGYLGGAVATHIRAGEGWGSTVPAFVFAAFTWVGLLLREPRLRVLLPLRKG